MVPPLIYMVPFLCLSPLHPERTRSALVPQVLSTSEGFRVSLRVACRVPLTVGREERGGTGRLPIQERQSQGGDTTVLFDDGVLKVPCTSESEPPEEVLGVS